MGGRRGQRNEGVATKQRCSMKRAERREVRVSKEARIIKKNQTMEGEKKE